MTRQDVHPDPLIGRTTDRGSELSRKESCVLARRLHVVDPYPMVVGATTRQRPQLRQTAPIVQGNTAQRPAYDDSTGTQDREAQRKSDRQRNLLDRQRKC